MGTGTGQGSGAPGQLGLNDPCVGLTNRQCTNNAECDYQNRVCVWTNAPTNQQNLYVIYDWKYTTVDGAVTTDEFCYSDLSTDSIDTKQKHQDYLDDLVADGTITNNKVCKSYGGKFKAAKKNKPDMCNSKLKKCKKLTTEACDYVAGCTLVAKNAKRSTCSGSPAF